FGGAAMNGLTAHQRTRLGLARSFQLPRPFGSLTLAENLRIPILYAVNARGERTLSGGAIDARCLELLGQVGLADKARQMPRDLTQIEMRKLELARAMAAEPKLLISDEAMAGLSHAEVDDVSLTVGAGETVALLGTNGNGKSTLMKSIMGMVRPASGTITATIDGTAHELVGRSTEEIVDLGIGFVPEGRRLFPKLTVTENLLLGAFRPTARSAIARNMDFCFETFPRLKERAKQLAGSM